jgi:hypothetical protein
MSTSVATRRQSTSNTCLLSLRALAECDRRLLRPDYNSQHAPLRGGSESPKSLEPLATAASVLRTNTTVPNCGSRRALAYGERRRALAATCVGLRQAAQSSSQRQTRLAYSIYGALHVRGTFATHHVLLPSGARIAAISSDAAASTSE